MSYILQGTGQHEDFMGHKGKLKTGDVQVIYTSLIRVAINIYYKSMVSIGKIFHRATSVFKFGHYLGMF